MTTIVHTILYYNYMLVTTSSIVQGKEITQYHGIATAHVVLGANIFRDIFAGIRDILGGRSMAYEKVFEKAKNDVIAGLEEKAAEMGGNAIVAVDIDYESLRGTMLMIAGSGTVVTIK